MRAPPLAGSGGERDHDLFLGLATAREEVAVAGCEEEVVQLRLGGIYVRPVGLLEGDELADLRAVIPLQLPPEGDATAVTANARALFFTAPDTRWQLRAEDAERSSAVMDHLHAATEADHTQLTECVTAMSTTMDRKHATSNARSSWV
eukprot:CAMPEP_0118846156 /NCGR_PEP_ID=MMETSP1162-20130426/91556_1 /TAXON_ID=33656 /ORGANISM="Phaeocystis Sp, Strain CCMP2710" /LENGTH=147 /DNA_ID=CAMNT_0006778331 /DNA_START=277 /DNA_END=719 /DNA_ORIENTATION=+